MDGSPHGETATISPSPPNSTHINFTASPKSGDSVSSVTGHSMAKRQLIAICSLSHRLLRIGGQQFEFRGWWRDADIVGSLPKKWHKFINLVSIIAKVAMRKEDF